MLGECALGLSLNEITAVYLEYFVEENVLKSYLVGLAAKLLGAYLCRLLWSHTMLNLGLEE